MRFVFDIWLHMSVISFVASCTRVRNARARARMDGKDSGETQACVHVGEWWPCNLSMLMVARRGGEDVCK